MLTLLRQFLLVLVDEERPHDELVESMQVFHAARVAALSVTVEVRVQFIVLLLGALTHGGKIVALAFVVLSWLIALLSCLLVEHHVLLAHVGRKLNWRPSISVLEDPSFLLYLRLHEIRLQFLRLSDLPTFICC